MSLHSTAKSHSTNRLKSHPKNENRRKTNINLGFTILLFQLRAEEKTLTAQEKTEEIASINQQLKALAEQVNNAKTETRKIIEKRDRLTEQIKNLRKEINDLRVERDKLNEKVQTLKMLRDEIRTKTRTIVEELKAIGEKITELGKNTPERSQNELQKELDSIEWKS